ncbi:MAG: DMT family transporter [Negativicutes bacterium]|nr:DMT family transporter [Negativicutes bacterium]
MNRTRLFGLLAVFSTSVFWGLSFVSIKITVAVIPPMTLALLRFILASAVLAILLKTTEPHSRLLKQDIPLMAVSGLLGVTAYYYFQNTGVKLTTVATASMVLASIPILTVLGELLVYKAKLSWAKAVSVVLSILGVYLIVVTPEETSPEGILGSLFMLGAAVSWVAYTFVTRPLTARYSQLAVVTYQTLFGTAALVPFTFFEAFAWQSIDFPILLHLLYLGLFCSALANVFYVYAMGVLGISSVALFINLIPVISVLGGYVILQESVSSLQILGGAIILLSVYITNRKSG